MNSVILSASEESRIELDWILRHFVAKDDVLAGVTMTGVLGGVPLGEGVGGNAVPPRGRLPPTTFFSS